jgi:hypothetical protein
MKVLSVRQPWAWAILFGGKDVENRSWNHEYRGLIVIHCSARKPSNDLLLEASELSRRSIPEDLSLGKLIGTVEVVDYVRNSKSRWANPGDWHWLLRRPKAFRKAITVKGRLGLWDLPARLLKKVPVR